jgi:hypothetical protein
MLNNSLLSQTQIMKIQKFRFPEKTYTSLREGY